MIVTALLVAGSGQAAVRQATPRTLESVLTSARGGDVVVLSPGSYLGVRLTGRTFSPELTLDARAATLTAMHIRRTSGVTIRGGTFHIGPPNARKDTGQIVFGAALRMDDVKAVKVTNASFVGPGGDEGAYGEGYGIQTIVGDEIQIDHSQFQGLKTGVVLTRVNGFRISNNTATLMRSDGFQVSKSWNGVIEGNSCKATRVRTDEHPDCIQLWSRPPYPPTANVVIRGNYVEGPTQGIGMFNHVRSGVDDGGFDRITIENNVVAVSRPNGITLASGRKSTVRNNKVSTLRNARFQAKIRVTGDVVRCGNTVAAGAGRPGAVDPKC